MRGKDRGYTYGIVYMGITPAYAGKSCRKKADNCCNKDHPRVCGEKAPKLVMAAMELGSPPRMRGKADFIVAEFVAERITPAYAGKSRS